MKNRRMVFVLLLIVIMSMLLISVQGIWAATPTISSFTNQTYLERSSAITIAPDVTVSGGSDFSDSWFEFELSGGTSTETLGLITVSSASTANGVVSIVGTDVYVGDGSTARQIGSVDAAFNGQNGQKLRINFSSPLANAQFTEPVVNDVIPGWEFNNNQVYPSTPAGHVALFPRTQSNELVKSGSSAPYTMTRTGYYAYQTDVNYSGTGQMAEGQSQRGLISNDSSGTPGVGATFSTAVVNDANATGGKALRLFSEGWLTVPNPDPLRYGSAFGPEVYSEPFTASAGDQLALNWRASGSGDDYEVYGYVLNTDNGVRTLLFYGRGSTQGWTTTTGTIPATGTYRFHFINGSYDRTGGYLLGAEFFIDNIRVLSSVSATDAVVQAVARSVTYHNSSCTPPASRTITARARNSTGTIGTASASILITPVNCPPNLTATAMNPGFSLGSSPATLFAGTSVSGPESSDQFVELRFTVSGILDATEEKILFDGSTIELSNGQTGTTSNGFSYSVTGTSPVTVAVSSSGASGSLMQNALNSMAYTNSAALPTPGERTVALTYLADNGGTANGGADYRVLSIPSVITVNKADQTISFAALPDKTYGDVQYNLNASATSGLAVYYSSSNPNVATVSGNTVTIVGAGSTTITVNQDGNAYYNAAPAVFQTLTILVKELTVTAADRSKDYGDILDLGSEQFTLSGMVNGDSISGVSMTSSGTASAAGIGEHAINITGISAGSGTDLGNYDITTVAGTLTVNPKPISVTITGNPTKVFDGNNQATLALADYSISGLIPGDSISIIQTSGTYSQTGYGEHLVTASLTNADYSAGLGTDLNNYSLQTGDITGPGTISKRTLDLTLTDKSKTYGQIDPVFEASYAGFVTGEGPETLGDVIIYRISGENVGTYDIGAFIWNEQDHSYTIVEHRGVFTIGQRPLTLINRQAADKVYDGLNSTTASAELSGVLSGDDVTLVLSDIAFDNPLVGANKPVTASQSLSGEDAANYSLMTETPFANASISSRPLTLSAFTATDKTYDGTVTAAFSYAADPVLGDDLGLDLSVSFSDKNIGVDKTVTLTVNGMNGPDAGNYTLMTPVLTTTATIHPILLTVSGAVVEDKLYDGTADAIISGAALQGVLSGETVTLTGQTSGQFPQTGVGDDLAVTAWMSLDGADSGNYELEQPILNSADILARPLTVTDAVAQDKVYDGTNAALLLGAQLIGAIAGDDVYLVNGDTGLFPQANVGNDLTVLAQMSLGGTDSGNYELVQPVLNPASILPKTLVVRADNKVKAYGQIDPVLTVSYESFADNEDLTDLDGSLIVWRQTGEDVSTYEIRLMSTLSSPNYTIQIVYGTLTIEPRVLTVSGAEAADKIYDGDTGATINGAILNGVLPADDGRVMLIQDTAGQFILPDAGTGITVITTMTLSGDRAANYVVQQPILQANIFTRPITVTPDAQSKTYSNPDPALTWQVTTGSLVGSDEPTGALSRVAGDSVGAYGILEGTLDFGANYDVTYADSLLTITAQPITVTADAQSMTYGDPDPALTWQVTTGSLAGSDEPTGALSRVAGDSVGAYGILEGTLDFGANYDVTWAGADLRINSRTLTIRAVSRSKIYGELDPVLTVEYLNLASWDSETVVQNLHLTREAGDVAGTYAIIPSGATADNYTVVLANGILTISKRPLTITADAQSREYGVADPSLTYAVTAGSLIGSDNLSGILVREPGENVGVYAILQNSLTAGKNYEISYIGATFVITPYAEPLEQGSVRNGYDPANSDQISYIAEAKDGYGFAYWSDGHTVFSTDPELYNPVGGISAYQAIIWPMGPTTDKQVIALSVDQKTEVSFLGGAMRMILPALADPEAVIAVTECTDNANRNVLPAGMTAVPRFYCLQRSENLVGESIRIEIDLAQAGIDLSENELLSLTLYRWNEVASAWETANITSQGIDTAAGVFWAEVEDFSTYGLYYTPDLLPKTGEELPRSMPWLLLLLAGSLTAILYSRRRLVRES